MRGLDLFGAGCSVPKVLVGALGVSLLLAGPVCGVEEGGLVLWNRLESSTGLGHSEVGPGGQLLAGKFVAGVFGNAIEVGTQNVSAAYFPSGVIPSQNGCVEFWAKVDVNTSVLPPDACVQLIKFETSVGGHVLPLIHFDPNDGVANGGLCARLSGFGSAGTGLYGFWTYEKALQGADVSAWHHYALVWSLGGLSCISNQTRYLAIFVDGKVNSGYWGGSGPPSPVEVQNGWRLGLAYLMNNAASRACIDNVKIWSYAKTDFSDRFVESAGYSEVVTFDPNGGAVSPSAKTVTVASAYGPLPEPTRTGYTFGDWLLNLDGEPSTVTAGSVVAVETNHTLKASWTPNVYTVTLEANGGAVSPESFEVTYDSTYGELPVPAAPETARLPYVFGGWFTEDGTAIDGGTTVTTSSDHSLYALWLAPPYLPDPSGDGALSGTGAYDGYLYAAEDIGGSTCTVVRGSLSLNVVAAAGKVTAKAVTRTGPLSFGASSWDSVGTDGTARVSMSLKGGETLELNVRQNRVWGSLAGGSLGDDTLLVDGARNRFKDQGDAAAQSVLDSCTGYYTVSLPAAGLVSQGESGAAPRGVGYLTLKIASAGSAKLAGVLADGTSFSAASRVILFGDDGWVCVPLACPLYARKGWLGGLLWIDPESRAVVTDREMGWLVRWDQSKGSPLDFDELLHTYGGYYEKRPELQPLYWFAARLGDVPYPTAVGLIDPVFDALPQDVSVFASGDKLVMEKGQPPYASSGKYVYPGANSAMAKMSFSPSTGVFKGSFYVYYDYEQDGRLRHVKVNVPYNGILVAGRGGAADSVGTRESLPAIDELLGTFGFGHCLVPDSGPAVKAYRLKRSYMVSLYPEKN